MLTHIVSHIFRTARPTNFKLGIHVRMEDDDPHHHGSHDLQDQRSRSQGYVIRLSRLGPMSLEADGGIPCRPNPGATLLIFIATKAVTRGGVLGLKTPPKLFAIFLVSQLCSAKYFPVAVAQQKSMQACTKLTILK